MRLNAYHQTPTLYKLYTMTITNENNMELMARYPNNYFDLAIVDPPYGILNKTKRGGDYKFNMAEYSKWDIKPSKEFFTELFRVSKNQIIWGGNYFGDLWSRSEYNKGFIIWDKVQPESLNNFSMAEMAWSSFDKPSKIFQFSVRKNRNKSHPTQKPVELYEWLLKLYAKQGVLVVPGSYLSREAHGENPGAGYVRIALVAEEAQCVEAAQRIALLT